VRPYSHPLAACLQTDGSVTDPSRYIEAWFKDQAGQVLAKLR
jgi:hypothetical protein